jgi:hypothetical protein
MSQVGKFVVPLMVAGAVLAVAGVTVASGQIRQTPVVHNLTTTDGTKIITRFDGKDTHARIPGPGGEVPLRDGDHKLTNGGSIKVVGGRVHSDAFGVVNNFQRKGILDPDG